MLSKIIEETVKPLFSLDQRGKAMTNRPSNRDILNLAGREDITAQELDILVSGSQSATRILENDVNKLRNKLERIEKQLDKP